jgi:hypothetical protein
MATRPAGLRTSIATLLATTLDLDGLRAFTEPVYFALGGKSNPNYYARMADRARTIFPNFTLDVFDARHHFDPPHPDRARAHSAGAASSLGASGRLTIMHGKRSEARGPRCPRKLHSLAMPKQSECDELVELVTDYFEQMRETSRVTGTLVSAGVPQQRIEALLRAARAFQAERAARQ